MAVRVVRKMGNVHTIKFKDSDAEQLLRLELENRLFFQMYTPLKEEEFYTIEKQKERIKWSLEDFEEGSRYSFGIFLDEDELIGTISLSEVIRGNIQGAWIGYALTKAQNGKGYTTEAVKQIVDFAFKELKLHRIEAGVMPRNPASIRVLEKAGFHKEGIAKENVRINGKWEDHQILAIVHS